MSSIHSHLPTGLTAPGILLQAVIRPNVSGVIRIAVHHGLTSKPSGPDELFLSGNEVRTFWCAFYGPDVLRKPWEPFDQPSSAAYMPLPYEAFIQINIGSCGRFLLQKVPTLQPFNTNVGSDLSTRVAYALPRGTGEFEQRLQETLFAIGIPTEAVPQCADAVFDQFPELRS